MTDATVATCDLCAPNCARCSISYSNCISCKTGWALWVQDDHIDVTDNSAATSNVVAVDYCVPSDGVSHWTVAGGANQQAYGVSGSYFELDAGQALVAQSCLQGFQERAAVDDTSYYHIEEINTEITAKANSQKNACHAGQCHPSCYTCEAAFTSMAFKDTTGAKCTACRNGWYLVEVNFGPPALGTCLRNHLSLRLY